VKLVCLHWSSSALGMLCTVGRDAPTHCAVCPAYEPDDAAAKPTGSALTDKLNELRQKQWDQSQNPSSHYP
jgi:hypothetical protein